MPGTWLGEGMKEKENKVYDLRELQKHRMGLFSRSHHLHTFELNLYPASLVSLLRIRAEIDIRKDVTGDMNYIYFNKHINLKY